jgi:hypothetical protein
MTLDPLLIYIEFVNLSSFSVTPTLDFRPQTPDYLGKELTLEEFSCPFLFGLFPFFSASVWCLKSRVSSCLSCGKFPSILENGDWLC